MICLTRRYRFSASHRLHSPKLSGAENQRLYGKCNNPYGHGHDYLLEVTAAGPIDPLTGLIVPLAALDRLVSENVLNLFHYRNINVDVRQFRHVTPTTENVALAIAEILQQRWSAYLGGTRAQLEKVFIQETDRNSFEVLARSQKARAPMLLENESLTVHV